MFRPRRSKDGGGAGKHKEKPARSDGGMDDVPVGERTALGKAPRKAGRGAVRSDEGSPKIVKPGFRSWKSWNLPKPCTARQDAPGTRVACQSEGCIFAFLCPRHQNNSQLRNPG
jgi:hypothetical protein